MAIAIVAIAAVVVLGSPTPKAPRNLSLLLGQGIPIIIYIILAIYVAINLR